MGILNQRNAPIISKNGVVVVSRISARTEAETRMNIISALISVEVNAKASEATQMKGRASR